MAAVSQQYIVIFSMLLRKQDTGLTHSKYFCFNVTLSDMQNKSLLSLALATVYRPPGPYTDFLKEFADFLSDLLLMLIKCNFNIPVDNPNDALGLAFTDLINSLESSKTSPGPLIVIITC